MREAIIMAGIVERLFHTHVNNSYQLERVLFRFVTSISLVRIYYAEIRNEILTSASDSSNYDTIHIVQSSFFI
jgi:low temperature requirement protein LtrA